MNDDSQVETLIKTYDPHGKVNLGEDVLLKLKDKDGLLPTQFDTKNLSKDQIASLKLSIEKIVDKSLTKKEVVALVQEITKSQKKPKKYRQAGHLIDQKLKYQPANYQTTIFDFLLPETTGSFP